MDSDTLGYIIEFRTIVSSDLLINALAANIDREQQRDLISELQWRSEQEENRRSAGGLV